MKALLVFWAKSFAALLAVVIVLSAAKQWDEAETTQVRASMQSRA